jgi:hypothetical protein
MRDFANDDFASKAAPAGLSSAEALPDSAKHPPEFFEKVLWRKALSVQGEILPVAQPVTI